MRSAVARLTRILCAGFGQDVPGLELPVDLERRQRRSAFPRGRSELAGRQLCVATVRVIDCRLTLIRYAGMREFARWAPTMRVVPYNVRPSRFLAKVMTS